MRVEEYCSDDCPACVVTAQVEAEVREKNLSVVLPSKLIHQKAAHAILERLFSPSPP